jgi:hypothetical protein
VSVGLLHRFPGGFVIADFSSVGFLASYPTPTLVDQGLLFVWPVPFDLSGMRGLPGAYAPASIALKVIGTRKLPLHNKAVVLEEGNMLQYQNITLHKNSYTDFYF